MIKQFILATILAIGTPQGLNIPDGESQATLYGQLNRNNEQVESTYNLYDSTTFENRYSNFSQYGYTQTREGMYLGNVYTQNIYMQTTTIRPAQQSQWIDADTPTLNVRTTLMIILDATYNHNYELGYKFVSNIMNLNNMGWTEAEYKICLEITNDTTPRADTVINIARNTKTTTATVDSDISTINAMIPYDYNYTTYQQAWTMLTLNANETNNYIPYLAERNNGTNTKASIFYIQLRKQIPADTGSIENITVLNNALSNYWESLPYEITYNYPSGYIPGGNTSEIVDIPGLIFTMLGMPFAWISTAFNLTLFPGTPYSINIANTFMALIGIVILIFILKKLLK